jgi:hypothetical protein
MTEKALVLDLIGGLPDDATFGEIVDTLALADTIRLGEKAADAGQVVPHEDVKRRLAATLSVPTPPRIDGELIDVIASGPGPRQVAEFRPSEGARCRVADLIAREKTSGLTAEETSELDYHLQIEHLMRLAKARARQKLGDE